MKRSTALLCGLVAFLAFPVAAQDRDYTEGPVMQVAAIKIQQGHFDEYMAYLKSSWTKEQQALKDAKAALHREPMPTIESSVLVVSGEQRRRRRFVNKPWQTMLRDSSPRQYYQVEGVRYREVDEDGQSIESNNEVDGDGEE